MIPRILVPVDVRPASADETKKSGHRLETYMDDRMVVPSGVSDAPPLDGKTSIPAHFPLSVLVNRTLVPRGMPAKAIESFQPLSEYAPIAILDARVVVPAYVEPPEAREIKEFVGRAPEMTPARLEVMQPDIFTTGDANLLIEPERKVNALWDLVTRSASVVVHIGLIIFLIFIPALFPPHIPTRDEAEIASRQLGVTYIPVDAIPKSPGPPPGPKVQIAPKVLNKVAPPRPESHAPVEAPRVERPAADLPSAPTPHVPVTQVPVQPSATPPPSSLLPVAPPANPGHGKLNLSLPNASPGKNLENQMAEAIDKAGRGGPYVAGGGGTGSGRGGGGGRSGLQNMQPGVALLTPTDGVDFDSYLRRLVATVKRNWYAIMPESALMGDRGVVVITFRINQDGTVPAGEPLLERTSGKGPLDTAAMGSIRASSPFEPLPSQFKRPEIQLRFIYFYNVPPDLIP